MPIFNKRAGVWKAVDKPFVKQAGVWRGADAIFVKVGGVWTKRYSGAPDAPPPAPNKFRFMGATADGQTRNFDWQASPGADSYEIGVWPSNWSVAANTGALPLFYGSQGDSFGTPINSPKPQSTIPVAGTTGQHVAAAAQFFYRVRAINAAGAGPWSKRIITVRTTAGTANNIPWPTPDINSYSWTTDTSGAIAQNPRLNISITDPPNGTVTNRAMGFARVSDYYSNYTGFSPTVTHYDYQTTTSGGTTGLASRRTFPPIGAYGFLYYGAGNDTSSFSTCLYLGSDDLGTQDDNLVQIPNTWASPLIPPQSFTLTAGRDTYVSGSFDDLGYGRANSGNNPVQIGNVSPKEFLMKALVGASTVEWMRCSRSGANSSQITVRFVSGQYYPSQGGWVTFGYGANEYGRWVCQQEATFDSAGAPERFDWQWNQNSAGLMFREGETYNCTMIHGS